MNARPARYEAVIVPSREAKAALGTIQIEAALKEPGVVSVLLTHDIPGLNRWAGDAPLLAHGAVEFAGQPIALVVGESAEACRRGARAVKVSYQPAPPVFELEHAVSMASFHGEECFVSRGDAVNRLDSAKLKLEGGLITNTQAHLCPQPISVFAQAGEDGIHLELETEDPDGIRTTVATSLGISQNKVHVVNLAENINARGREIETRKWAALAALAALRTGESVRIQLTHEEDLAWTSHRRPVWFTYNVGFDTEGSLEALQLGVLVDGGAYDLGASETMEQALLHLDNFYHLPNLEVEGHVCLTHFPPSAPILGGGVTEGIAIIEEIMSRIAAKVKLPPERVRRRNLYRPEAGRNTTHYGQSVPARDIDYFWVRLMEATRVELRREEIKLWNEEHTYRKRGLGIVPVKYGIGHDASGSKHVTALINVCGDGSVQVHAPGCHVDGAIQTRLRETVGAHLGVHPDSVSLAPALQTGITNPTPSLPATEGALQIRAALNACSRLHADLRPLALQLLAGKGAKAGPMDELSYEGSRITFRNDSRTSLEFTELVAEAHRLGLPLSALGTARAEGRGWNPSAFTGQPFERYVLAAAVADVEVDLLTGEYTVHQIDLVQDRVGKACRSMDEDLIELGFRFGYSWLVREGLDHDEHGQIITAGYPMASIGDLSGEFLIHAVEVDDGPKQYLHGAPLSQTSVPLAWAVREGVIDAMTGTPHADLSGGVPLPLTIEAVLGLLR